MRILMSAAAFLALGRFLLPSLAPGGPRQPAQVPTAESVGAVQEKQGELMRRMLQGTPGAEADPEAAFRAARQRAEAEAAELARAAARTPGQAGAVRTAYTQARLAFEFGSERAATASAAPRAEAHNGRVGRDIGARAAREARVARPATFNSEARIRELVLDALRRGRLDTSSAARRD